MLLTLAKTHIHSRKHTHTHTHTLCYESYDKLKDNHLHRPMGPKCSYEDYGLFIPTKMPLWRTYISYIASVTDLYNFVSQYWGLTVIIIALYLTFSFSKIKMLLHFSKGYEKCWKMHLISYGLTVELLSDWSTRTTRWSIRFDLSLLVNLL